MHDDTHRTQNDFHKLHQIVVKELSRRLKRAERRLHEHKQRLAQCLNWKHTHHLGELLQAHLYAIKPGMSEIRAVDWEQEGKEVVISLPYGKPPHIQVAEYFKAGKKLHRGIPHAERQTAIVEKEVKRLVDLIASLEKMTSFEELETFAKNHELLPTPPQGPKVHAKPPPTKPFHRFISASGREIWVGKSAKDNDKLSFHCAHGLDWWMHAKDYSGSHVVIPSKHNQELDEATLLDAAELALRYSKASSQRLGEVTLTQVKWIKSVAGIPGRVMVSKHRTVRLKLDDERWQRLKHAKVTHPHP